ncbi:MAG TPA: response regulator [Solirubrobacteraceae bacterium]|jgi:DNA-binding NarL/FixJ family response regulator|nr:response regulator [Solirubrobacteraceae bacterium]
MGHSILVVDDDPMFLSLATRILAQAGLEVVATAGDAAGAVGAANATRPAAVLVDVGLPDRAGVDLAYELAALPWRPRVVLTSTDSDAGYAVEAPEGQQKLPFIPKDELANGRLPGLLASR